MPLRRGQGSKACSILLSEAAKVFKRGSKSSRVNEIAFTIEQEAGGRYITRAADQIILVRADSVQELRTKVISAVRLSLPKGSKVRVRFQFGCVRTLSLLGYLAAIYAWLVEIGVVLMSIFTKIRFGLASQIIIFALMLLFSGFAWRRREDFRSLRYSGGRIPLTDLQSLIVAAFIIAFGGLVSVVAIAVANQ